MKPSKHKMTLLSQIFKLIPRNLIPKISNEFGIDKQSRTFSPTSHVFALFFGQLTHAIGLNDIYDALRNHCGLLNKIRECAPPSRNGLSHANRNQDAGMAEKLFWDVLAHLNEISPNFKIQGKVDTASSVIFSGSIEKITHYRSTHICVLSSRSPSPFAPTSSKTHSRKRGLRKTTG